MGSSFILILAYKLELAEAEKERFLPSSNTFRLSSLQDNLNVNIQRAESLNPIFWSNFNIFSRLESEHEKTNKTWSLASNFQQSF